MGGIFEGFDSVNEMFNRFHELLMVLISCHVPLKGRRRKMSISRNITNIVKRLQTCAPNETDATRTLQLRLDKVLHRQRVLLEHEIANSCDTKRFYGYVNNRLKVRDDLSVIETSDGVKLTDDRLKANYLCNYFQETYSCKSAGDTLPVLYPKSIPVIDELDVSSQNVLRQLQRLEAKTSLSPEQIPALFFKRAAQCLSMPLSIIFRRSLDSSEIPDLYRHAWVVPVHKSGSRIQAGNKRPVSLTAVSCRLLERIICEAMMKNAEENELTSDDQYAYRNGKSTTDCLTVFFNDIALYLNNGKSVDVVFTDLKSAFESMPHERILSTLPLKGVGPKVVQWISSFLKKQKIPG